jgi:hypothetical protein
MRCIAVAILDPPNWLSTTNSLTLELLELDMATCHEAALATVPAGVQLCRQKKRGIGTSCGGFDARKDCAADIFCGETTW